MYVLAFDSGRPNIMLLTNLNETEIWNEFSLLIHTYMHSSNIRGHHCFITDIYVCIIKPLYVSWASPWTNFYQFYRAPILLQKTHHPPPKVFHHLEHRRHTRGSIPSLRYLQTAMISDSECYFTIASRASAVYILHVSIFKAFTHVASSGIYKLLSYLWTSVT